MFVHEKIPTETCEARPELKKLGIYRIFDCNQDLVNAGICQPGQAKVRERVSYCKPQIERYFGIRDDDLERILKEAGIKD